MDRIKGASTVDIGGGRPGFRDRNKAAGLSGTNVLAVWLNNIQEELLALIEEAGLAPDEANATQILASLRRMFGLHVAFITASQPVVVPAGARKMRGQLWAAGGGGGGTYGGSSAASGGGGGGYAEGLFDVSPGQNFFATIGLGGSPGSVNAGNGGDGGASGLGSLLSASGGMGGTGANGVVASTGGGGGIGTGGQFQVAGLGGGLGQPYANGVMGGGFGGASWCGTKAGPNIGVAAGHNGGSPGCGGSGGAIGGNGGRGANGLIILEFGA